MEWRGLGIHISLAAILDGVHISLVICVLGYTYHGGTDHCDAAAIFDIKKTKHTG